LNSINTLGATARAITRSLRPLLSRHRAITRIAVATLSLAIAMAFSLEGAAAGPTRPPTQPTPLLPQNVGVGLLTTDAVTITFAEPMDPASVATALSLRPQVAFRTLWRADGRTLLILPAPRWQTDARYVISVAAGARRADGSELGAMKQVSFTTQTAPIVADFELRYVDQPAEPVMRALTDSEAATSAVAEVPIPAPPDTASLVSTTTSVTIGFSAVMDHLDVVRHLVLSPFVPGMVTWSGNSMVFTPTGRLEPNARYALSVAGAHDAAGNPLGGDASFSFTTRVGAQVVKISPLDGAKDVAPADVSLWFSQAMDTTATATALNVTDATSGAAIAGKTAWNDRGTQLRFTPAKALAKGHTIKVSLADGAGDSDHNAVTGTWSFRTKAPPQAPSFARRAAPGPAAPADLVQFALWQINQERAAYGFPALSLDSGISAVASAQAWDMLTYGYFSHIGRDGSTVSIRLSRAGIGFTAAGENICYLGGGSSAKATLQWCHSTFMSEPYPGYANHIGNILGTRYSRVGIGIAQSGPKVIVVWDYAG
jgi:uncharacterized protein YkwD